MKTIHKGVKIFEAIDKTSYNHHLKNEIINSIYDIFSTKISRIYLITRLYSNHEETIFLINHYLPIIFDKKQIYISLLVYLPSKFPLAAPEIHLEKKDNNSELKSIYNNNLNKFINNSTLQIYYELLIKWNQETRNLGQIMQVIKKEFDRNYPFSYTNFPVLCYNGLCVLQPQYLIPIILTESPKQQLIQRKSPCKEIQPRNSSIDYHINKPNNQVSSLMNDILSLKFTDDVSDQDKIINILKREISVRVPNIITKQKNTLLSQRNDLGNLLIKYRDKSAQQNKHNLELVTLLSSYDFLNGKLNKFQSDLQSEMAQLQSFSNKPLSFNDLNSIIEVDPNDQKILSLTCMELTIEDYLLSLKKVVQKNTIQFSEVVRQHRSLARERFYLFYLNNKARTKLKERAYCNMN